MAYYSTSLNWNTDWPGHTAQGYDIFVDGIHYDRVSGPPYTVKDLQENQFYAFGVQPYDNGGSGPLFMNWYMPVASGKYNIPGERLTKWNPGLNAVGGIPDRTIIFDQIPPSGGDDTATIQAALDNCLPNQVVQLEAGIYNITGQGLSIERSNITLRGVGPGLGNIPVDNNKKSDGTGTGTSLVKVLGTNYPVVIIGPRWGGSGTAVNLTKDAIKGTYSVTVDSTVGLSIGGLVTIHTITDPDISHWNSQDPENLSGWFNYPDRPLGQTMEIQSISGNTVTFTTPFHITYKISRSAKLLPLANQTNFSGIEELMVYGGEGGDGGGGIHLYNSKCCWVKHSESCWSVGGSIHIDNSFRCELRDSFFHDSQFGLHSGGANYGIGFQWYTSDTLVENCISVNFNKCMVMRSTGGGNVIGYNYLDNGADTGGTWFEDVLTASHMTTPHYELLEGNCAANFDQDDRWGNSVYVTIFRNHLTGVLRDWANSGPWRAAGITQWHWWHSFVGNILCQPGHVNIFRYEEFDENNPTVWMWCYQASDNVSDNGKSIFTGLRDGNFDFYTYSVHWHGIGGSGVDSGLTPPINAELLDSMYLKSKPAFFGVAQWPWTQATDSSRPMRGQLPARLRYDSGFPNKLEIV